MLNQPQSQSTRHMKAWQLCVHDPEVGEANFYYSSKREAEQAQNRMLRGAKADERADFHIYKIHQILIPTDRKGLLAWLNQNAVTQDGFGDLWSSEYA